MNITDRDLRELTDEVNNMMDREGRKRLPRKVSAELLAQNLKRCGKCTSIFRAEDFGASGRCKSCGAEDSRGRRKTLPTLEFALAEGENVLDVEVLKRWTLQIDEWFKESKAKLFTPDNVESLHRAGARRCFKCEKVHPLPEFSAGSDRFGLSSSCKRCQRGYQRGYYEENKNHVLDRAYNYRLANPGKSEEWSKAWYEKKKVEDPWYSSCRHSRRRAREAGLPVEGYSSEELVAYWKTNDIDPERCYYTGVELTDDNRSVDHVVPLSSLDSPGDVLSNVVPCDRAVNASKGNRDEHSWKEILVEQEAC